MRRILLAAVMTTLCSIGYSEPVAQWASSPTFLAKHRALSNETRNKYCLPEPSDIAPPLYPNVEVLAIGMTPENPGCKAPQKWTPESVILFVSTDSFSKVANWYKKKMKGLAMFARPEAVVFLPSSTKSFDWNKDWGYTKPYVLIKPAARPWQDGGYRTTISIRQPSNNALKGERQTTPPP